MEFLDKMTKTVGDVVNRGKKDLDQFMRIQKINGEIGRIETKVAGLRKQIPLVRQEAGAKAIELVKEGSISFPDLDVFVEKLATIDQKIAVEQAAIETKKAEIEQIRAEQAAIAAKKAEMLQVRTEHAVEQAPALNATTQSLSQDAKACPQCGKLATSGTFCRECGARL